MNSLGARFTAGAMLLVLPLGAALLMWLTAGDVVAPEVREIVARAPGTSDDAPVETLEVPLDVSGYRQVPPAGNERLTAALDDALPLPGTVVRQVTAIEDDNGRVVGVSLAVEDPRRGADHPDGATNLRALLLGGSDLGFRESSHLDAGVFTGRHGENPVLVWQRPTGFTMLLAQDAGSVQDFARALKRST